MQEYRVYINQLRVGVFIRLDRPWYEHPFLFGSFKIKSQEQIDTLKELGFSTVICVPDKSDQLPRSAAAQCELPAEKAAGEDTQATSAAKALWDMKRERIERLKAQRDKLNRCEKHFERTLDRVKNMMNNIGTAMPEVVEEANGMIAEMVTSFLSEKDLVIHLMNTKSNQEEICYHSLNTAVLGLLLGREYGLDAQALQKLGLALIFHDVGKQRIPKKILYKPTPFTPPELKLYQMHPTYGEEIISARAPDFPVESLDVIKKHHETLDGKGFPAGLSGEAISPVVRLASIVDTYDNLCNKLDVNASMTPYQALSFMFGKQQKQLDRELVALFVRCLGIYPPGTDRDIVERHGRDGRRREHQEYTSSQRSALRTRHPQERSAGIRSGGRSGPYHPEDHTSRKASVPSLRFSQPQDAHLLFPRIFGGQGFLSPSGAAAILKVDCFLRGKDVPDFEGGGWQR